MCQPLGLLQRASEMLPRPPWQVLLVLLATTVTRAEDPTIQVGDTPWEHGLAWFGIVVLVCLSGKGTVDGLEEFLSYPIVS